MLLQTRVTTVTPIQNNHSTPTHRASQSCFFPSKFPLYLILEEEASNDASSAPWKDPELNLLVPVAVKLWSYFSLFSKLSLVLYQSFNWYN